jgi:hypothetical protein
MLMTEPCILFSNALPNMPMLMLMLIRNRTITLTQAPGRAIAKKVRENKFRAENGGKSMEELDAWDMEMQARCLFLNKTCHSLTR